MTGGMTNRREIDPAAAKAGLPGFPAVDRMLESQQRLYAELEGLSRRQAELIAAERTDELLGILGTRETIIGKIQAINDSLAGVRAHWDQFLSGLDPAQKGAIGSRIAAITGVIEGIARRDQIDRDQLRGKRDEIAGELTVLDRSRRASAAYGPGAGAGPLFQDREA